MNAELLPAVIAAGGAVLGAVAGGGATYYIQKLNIKNNENEQRRQAYSKLTGKKILLLQSYISYYIAFIQSQRADSYCTLETLCGKEEGNIGQDDINQYIRDSVSCQEAMKMKTKYENLQLEIAKNECTLWETIGQIQFLFPDAVIEIDELIRKIKSVDEKFVNFEKEIKEDKKTKFDFINQHKDKYYRGVELNYYGSCVGHFVDSRPTKDELDKWSNAKSKELEDWYREKESKLIMLINELEEPIDQLLSELLKIIKEKRS